MVKAVIRLDLVPVEEQANWPEQLVAANQVDEVVAKRSRPGLGSKLYPKIDSVIVVFRVL